MRWQKTKPCAKREDACRTFSLSLGNDGLHGMSLHALMNDSHGDALPIFHPEFGRFMLEATPGKPWGIGLKDLLEVEPNMKWRFVRLTQLSFGFLLIE